MIRFTLIFIFIWAKQTSSIEHDYKGFDDSILFGINWPGSKNELDNLVSGSEDGKAKFQVRQ